MALKDTPSFELESYKDLFLKADYDLQRLKSRLNSYDLYNFLCTINHLHDWVKHETGKECPRPEGSILDIVRRLCNRAKHFKNQSSPPTQVKRGLNLGFNGNFSKPPNPIYWITRDDGRSITALELCQCAITEWEMYLMNENLL